METENILQCYCTALNFGEMYYGDEFSIFIYMESKTKKFVWWLFLVSIEKKKLNKN